MDCVDRPVTVLTLDAPTLTATLRSGYFRRAAFDVVTAESTEDLLERAARAKPHAVIVIAGRVSPRGERSIARELRARQPGGLGLLLLALPPERADIEEDLTLYDGLVSLEEPEADLIRALQPLAALAPRFERRSEVYLRVRVLISDQALIDGHAVDISSNGAGLVVPGTLPLGTCCGVQFYRSEGRQVVLRVRSVWTAAPTRMGVRFVDATLHEIRALYDLALWDVISDDRGGDATVRIHGRIGAATRFDSMLARAAEARCLDLSDVVHIDDQGVLRWFDLLTAIRGALELRLRRVSVPMARRMVSTPAMLRGCVVESLYVPYECRCCNAEATRLERPMEGRAPPRCAPCGGAMVPSDPSLAAWSATARAADEPRGAA